MMRKGKIPSLMCAALLLMLLPFGASAFTCKAAGVVLSGSGTVNVPVTLTPEIQVSQNLVVNLGNSIQCKNDAPQFYLDPIRVGVASAFGGALANFRGSMSYYGSSYPFPTTTATKYVNHTWGTYQPWNTVLYLTATGAAGGVVIPQGSLIASLRLEKGGSDVQVITWNLYAANSVVVPTGGCDVSSRNVTVNLPDYPATQSVPLTVRCAANQQLAYYLTGTTTDTGATIFANTASSSPAQGIGIQLRNNAGILKTNQNVSMGTVGTSSTSLNLVARYERTGPQVVSGNVQSVIGVTFIYQ